MAIDGNPAGAVYFDGGDVTFARSSWSPDLAARLCAVLRHSAEVCELLPGIDRPDGDLGAVLVARGYLTADQLHAILRSAIIDAVMVLTVPLAQEASVADIRLEPDSEHWAGSFCRLPVQRARAEAARQAERMAGHGLAPADLVGAGPRAPCPPGRQATPEAGRGWRQFPAGAAIAGPRRGTAEGSAARRPRRPADTPPPLPPESFRRILDGLRNLG